ncbi:hypothetical protein J1N35_044982 [Gossypium stocksii]|uniref:Uncharacterized protein n=1 Tax=Gossypium stocksii TaxID=47602 RepID=A0A9D3UAH1_9ROSI|nr:hypothetical protein J1N35_044982 [Gossypium stocksii]
MISHTTSLRSLCNFGMLDLHTVSSSPKASFMAATGMSWLAKIASSDGLVLMTDCGRGEIGGMENKKHNA